MEIKRKVWTNSKDSSVLMVIPKDIATYLEIEDGSEIVLKPEEGKHGRFCSFWNEKHTNPNKNNGANSAPVTE